MRAIDRTNQFKRDYKRESRGRHRETLQESLNTVLTPLLNDVRLAPRFQDHALAGQWVGFRDCHVKPDLVLIYELPDGKTLRLVRLGSHSELGW